MAMRPELKEAKRSSNIEKSVRFGIVANGAGIDAAELAIALGFSSRTSIYRLLSGEAYLTPEHLRTLATLAAGRRAWASYSVADLLLYLNLESDIGLIPSRRLRPVDGDADKPEYPVRLTYREAA